MPKKSLSTILFIFLTGCDFDMPQLRTFKWAVVDKNKIQASVFEEFKKSNPYPPEINQDADENSRERSFTREQASDLENTAKLKCRAAMLKDSSTKQPNIRSSLGMNAPIALAPSIDWEYEQKLKNSPVYQECLNNIKQDPLIADLKDKSRKIEEIFEARRKHDIEVRKIADKAIEVAVTQYAEKNKLDLIVTNQFYNNDNNVLYNKNKVILDVTPDVVKNLKDSLTNKKDTK